MARRPARGGGGAASRVTPRTRAARDTRLPRSAAARTDLARVHTILHVTLHFVTCVGEVKVASIRYKYKDFSLNFLYCVIMVEVEEFR